jgi:hypothetical protein
MRLTPLMHRLTIQKKDLKIERLDLDDPFAWAQKKLVVEIERQYNLGLPVRIIVLKGRQLGISTASEGVLFNWTFLHPGTRSLVIAHETRAAQHLFDMTKLMWEEWPFRDVYHEKHNSQKTLSWLETRSSMSVATARNAGSGRSFTYHAVHCSECAFWEDPERLMVGLNQSVPYKHGTVVILESTANGVGNWFHEEWVRAKNGESQYIPLFFPWYNHDEYSFNTTALSPRDFNRTERELSLRHSLTPGQIAWRRHTIKNDCLNDEKQFNQEYPCTPDEAFLSTGTNVFPLEKLEECYERKNGIKGQLHDQKGRIEFIPDASGNLTIFKWPGHDPIRSKYVVCGDPSRTTEGDGACIQVINRFTFEQVAVWHGNIDPRPFAHKLIELGFFYNTALVNCEIEGPGYGTIAVLLELDYPDIWQHKWADKHPGKLSHTYGWSTSYKRKHQAVGNLIWLIGQNALKIHDEKTYSQMQTYVTLPNGELGPASWKMYDDAVMAMAIAVTTHMTEPPLPYTDDSGTPALNDLFDSPPWEAVS